MSFMLGAYWSARSDGIEECTENSRNLFAGLAEIDPLLGQWYRQGRSLKDALKRKIDMADLQIVREQLLRGRNRRDVGNRDVIEELGFSISLWNGAREEEARATIGISCGCYSKYVGNNVLIDLPEPSGNPAWIERADSLLALVAELWRPRWAGIMSDQAMHERDFSGARPFVDWMVYVPRPIEAVPAPGRVRAMPGLGSLIVVQPDPPLGNDPEELPRIRRVESILAA